MKKTLVAVAALAAVFGAQAEATIYGVFDQAYTTARAANAAGAVTSTTNSMGSPWTGNGFVMGVKAGEDVMEGLKLSGVYELGLTLNSPSTTPYTRQSFVALSGAFGQVRAGRQYAPAFNNAAAVDPGGATLFGTLYQTVVTDGTGAGESPLRQSNTIQYDLPNLVPGLNLGLNLVRAGANTVSGVATGDGTGFNASYTNGALFVGYTQDAATNTAAGQFVGTPATSRIAASGVNERKLTTTSASYDFGMAKIGYNNSVTSIAADKINTSMFAVSAPIGAATVYVSSSNGTQSGAVAASLKGNEYGVNYSLSKRTTVYGRIGSNSINTIGSAKSTALGLQHAF